MKEPHVLTCQATDCSYNCDAECCAPNIEIGDEHPMCDMYTTNDVSMGKGEPEISMCKVDRCHYNHSMSCGAAGITMTRHSGHADCGTYRR